MKTGKLLKKFRVDNHISQKGLSSLTGMSVSRISKIEADISKNIGIETVLKYLEGINVSPKEFFSELFSQQD